MRGDGLIQRLEPLPQQADQLVRRQDAALPKRRLEPGVLPLGLAEQLAQPVPQLVTARLGDPVSGPLRLPALAGHLDSLDEPVLLQVLHHGVERTPIDLDGLVLAVLAQLRGHLVGVHWPLRQQRQQRQRHQVADLAPPCPLLPGHPNLLVAESPLPMTRYKVLVDEYRHGRVPPATPIPNGPLLPNSPLFSA